MEERQLIRLIGKILAKSLHEEIKKPIDARITHNIKVARTACLLSNRGKTWRIINVRYLHSFCLYHTEPRSLFSGSLLRSHLQLLKYTSSHVKWS